MADTPHNYGSFSYKVFDTRIKRALKMRSELDNTIQVAMPFVKATTTIQIPEYLGQGNIGFTLGPHVIPEDVRYEDLYSQKDQFGYPLIGYTYTSNGRNQPVYCKVPNENTQRINLFLNQGLGVVTLPDESGNAFSRIPPPGITQTTIGRNKNGLLVSAQLQITVPSLIQLEALHRTFLIPGMGMIVEWGQQFASQQKNIYGQQGLTGTAGSFEINTSEISQGTVSSAIEQFMFPWYRPSELSTLLERLGKRQVGIQEILDNYVYPTQGQYMWMFGRVANFSIKGTADGSYDVTVKIVGPSEDSWAYSTKNTITQGVKLDDPSTYCAGNINSIREYFETGERGGFQKLLTKIFDDPNHPWASHVFKIQNGHETTAPSTNFISNAFEWLSDKRNSALDTKQFQDVPDAYYITWRFFVNMVLNGGVLPGSTDTPEENTLLRVFKNSLSPEQFERVALIRPYTTTKPDGVSKARILDDEYENRVGANAFLRSVDISTMILANPFSYQKDGPYRNVDVTSPIVKETWNSSLPVESAGSSTFEQLIERTGGFLEAAGEALSVGVGVILPGTPGSDVTGQIRTSPRGVSIPDFVDPDGSLFGSQPTTPSSQNNEPSEPDFAYLSSGVWLNHKAIIEAMASAETFLQGMTNLLQRMSNATNNYWALALDPVEPIGNDNHTYSITDTNYKPRSTEAVAAAIGNVDDEDEITAPNRLYTFNKYVRTTRAGKLVGSELLEANIDLSLPKRLFAQIAAGGLIRPEDQKYTTQRILQPSALISEPNEDFRLMYAISTISPELFSNQSLSNKGRGPDLTISAFQPKQNGFCAGTNSVGYAGVTVEGTIIKKVDELLPSQLNTALKDAESVLSSEICNACTQNTQCQPVGQPTTISNTPLIPPTGKKKLSQLTIAELKKAQASGVNAVGKYQAIPGTLREWTQKKQISDNIVFSPSVQEELGNWLVLEKRGKMRSFWANQIDAQGAAEDLRQEFLGLNRVPTDELVNLLDTARVTGDITALKQRIASVESGSTENAYEQINRGTAGDTRLDSDEYYAALNVGVDSTTLTPQPPNSSLSSTPVKTSIGKFKQCEERSLPRISRGLFGKLSLEQNENGTITQGPPGDEFGTSTTLSVSEVMSECDKCFEAEIKKARIEQRLQEKGGPVEEQQRQQAQQYRNLSQLMGKYQEYNPSYMISLIRGKSNDSLSNAVGTAPGALSLSADITLPGINGLRVGQLFWIDRIPALYKVFGAFQILSIEDTIDINGWRTSIHSRFNYLGREWRERVVDLLLKQGTTLA